MANGAPLYASDVRPPVAREQGFGVIPLPSASGGEQLGQAIARFGETGMQVAAMFAKARNETAEAVAETEFITKLAAQREQAVRSTDWQNTPQQFNANVSDLESEAAARVSPMQAPQFKLKLRRHALSAEKEVSNAALARQVDADVASYQVRSADWLRGMANGSETERASIRKDWDADIDALALRGSINGRNAVELKQARDKALDDRDAMEAIRLDPRAAQRMLEDPTKFPSLDPLHRQSRINQARSAVDNRASLELTARANVDAAGAMTEIGRVVRPEHADPIFDRGIIPIESQGRADAVSPKGALGVAQVMPDTAREMAVRLGRADIARLPDDDLKTRLLEDPATNRELGRAYWRLQVGRYATTPVQIAAAAAAYNAGPGRADRWVAAARAKFGESFTADEFVSVIDIRETRDYVIKLHDKLGASLDRRGLSIEGQFHAAGAAQTAVAGQHAEAARIAREVAQAGRVIDNPAQLQADGLTPDPTRYSQWKQLQANAAATGDFTAAKALREAELREAMLPDIQRIQRMAPAEAEAYVRGKEAALYTVTGATSEERERVTWLREAFDATKKLANEDPISLGERTRLVAPSAIDPRAGLGDLERQLAARGQASAPAAAYYGVEEKPFKPEELKGFKERWSGANSADKFGLLQTMARALPQNTYRTAVAQIGGDAMTQYAGEVALSRPELAREILRGAELMGMKEVADKAALIKPALAAKFGGQVYTDPAMQDAAINAALAIYTAERGTNGALYDPTDASAFEKAIEKVTGPIAKRNGRRTPAPPGMTTSAFAQVMDNLTIADLTPYGGAYDIRGVPMDARDLGRRATVTPLDVGSPRYLVMTPTPDGKGAPVMTYDRGPLVIDVAEIAIGQRGRRVASPMQVLQSRIRATQTLGVSAPGPEP